MKDTVYCSPEVLKQISHLEKAGGKAVLALKQAQLIAQLLKTNDTDSPFLKNKQTNSGEKRLKNREKYDLGAGYRLVCQRNSKGVIIEFIGTHDKTDLWINHNRAQGIKHRRCSKESASFPIQTTVYPSLEDDTENRTEEIDHYEENLLKQIDEKMLQQIFCGFTCRANQD